MPRKSEHPKERRHVHLFQGDWDRLVELYGNQRITPSHVIAKLVKFHLRRVDEKINLRMTQQEIEDVDADLSEEVAR